MASNSSGLGAQMMLRRARILTSERTETAASIALLWLLVVAVGSCAPHKNWPTDSAGDSQNAIQRIVEQRLDQQRAEPDGPADAQKLRGFDYQDEAFLQRILAMSAESRQRLEAAEQYATSRPLSLSDCLLLSLEFNDRIQAGRKEIDAVGGSELVTRSRFLPQLDYVLRSEHQTTGSTDAQSQTGHVFRYSQTLLEFGKDSPQDVALRQSQRDALFTYEQTVQDALSDVRRVFFTIKLREQQVAQRKMLLEEFRVRYQQIQELEEARRTPQLDVLTARLNVLNEELRINGLEKEIVRQKIGLLRLLGLSVGLTDVAVVGQLSPFDVDVDGAVSVALRRSTSIAQARSVVFEQARLAAQIFWENAPELAGTAGWKQGGFGTGFDAASDNGTYSLSPFAEKHLDAPDGGFLDRGDRLDGSEEGWFLGLELEVPLFDGLEQRGKIIRERARLSRTRHELRDAVNRVEQDVRQAYQTMLERRKELEIQRETVDISKQRLSVQEQLKELGKISDNELETFRDRFFGDQDRYFDQQITLVEAQERLRSLMRYFEPTDDDPPQQEAGGDPENATWDQRRLQP